VIELLAERVTDLPLPVGVIDRSLELHWRNARWQELDPVYGLPFIWPVELSRTLAELQHEERAAVLRGIKHRHREDRYDLWLRSYDAGDGLFWVVAGERSGYEREAADQLLEQRLHEVQTLIRGILHEVRNPLAGLHAAVQLLLRKSAPAEVIEEYRQMLGDVRRIDQVLEELVGLADPLRLARRKTNVHAVLDEAIATVDRLARLKHVQIRRSYDPSLPDPDLDADRMYRVYLNLLKNAVEASPAHSEVTVETSQLMDWQRGKVDLVVRICDQGEGIADEVAPLLFTPMFSTKQEGTGLGLALSRQIVQAHAGELRLQNRSQEPGVVASVRLPLPGRH